MLLGLKEECHALPPHAVVVPTEQSLSAYVALKDLWDRLPAPCRQQTLQALSRVIQQQIRRPSPTAQEGDHEDA
jgi:hypothetical protein